MTAVGQLFRLIPVLRRGHHSGQFHTSLVAVLGIVGLGHQGLHEVHGVGMVAGGELQLGKRHLVDEDVAAPIDKRLQCLGSGRSSSLGVQEGDQAELRVLVLGIVGRVLPHDLFGVVLSSLAEVPFRARVIPNAGVSGIEFRQPNEHLLNRRLVAEGVQGLQSQQLQPDIALALVQAFFQELQRPRRRPATSGARKPAPSARRRCRDRAAMRPWPGGPRRRDCRASAPPPPWRQGRSGRSSRNSKGLIGIFLSLIERAGSKQDVSEADARLDIVGSAFGDRASIAWPRYRNGPAALQPCQGEHRIDVIVLELQRIAELKARLDRLARGRQLDATIVVGLGTFLGGIAAAEKREAEEQDRQRASRTHTKHSVHATCSRRSRDVSVVVKSLSPRGGIDEKLSQK